MRANNQGFMQQQQKKQLYEFGDCVEDLALERRLEDFAKDLTDPQSSLAWILFFFLLFLPDYNQNMASLFSDPHTARCRTTIKI